MMTDSLAHPHHDLIIVGGGPRAISLIERLTARSPHPALRLAVIDRFEVGAGATWRTDQTPHFLNNTYAAHTTIYPDESTPMTGPLTPGPDLIEWAGAVAAGQGVSDDGATTWRAPSRPAWAQAEAARLQPWSYPTRRLQGVYYREQLEAILARGGVSLDAVVGVAAGIEARGKLRVVHLEDGREFTAPLVVLAQGMVQARPAPSTRAFTAAAARHRLTYIPPGMPSERDWSILPEGEPVLTAGLGANFFDVITLLTEGRGGVFTPRSGPFDLAYEPSGREPRFVVGSRRGLPYRSKSFYGALPPRYEPQLATPEWFRVVGERENQDFARDVWPQFLREFTAAHLATLAASRPLVVPGAAAGPRPANWADPATVPLAADLLEAIACAPAAGLAELVRERVTVPAHHFDPQRLDRPDWDPGTETWEEWTGRWVAAERAAITDPLRSPRATVNRAMALLRAHLARVLRAVDPASQQRDVEGWFAGISLALASGPPPERTARLLALVEAGIVQLLGEGSQFDVAGGQFVGRSPARGQVRARALIETRMSKGHVDVTDDPLLTSLTAAGAARLHTKISASGKAITTRTLDVTPGEFALIDARGQVDRRVRVLGIPAGDVQPGSAIGATPHLPSPLLAGADRIAGQALALLHEEDLAPVP